MQLEIYQAETSRIANQQQFILNIARAIMLEGRPLSQLEQGGVLHALQVIIENAIGKAKNWLKAKGQHVPVSAYDAFQALAECGLIDSSSLQDWNAVIGLRNRIVQDYMNIDFALVIGIVRDKKEQFIIDFLQLHPPQ